MKTENMPKISIIVPIYNVEKYLDRCLNSLMNQTLKEIEIILVDDGSPDNCPKMCDEYAKKDSRIKVIHKINGGLGYARNSGIEIAKGEYLAFVDSDDYIDLDFYEKLYENRNDADVVFGGFKKINDNGKITEVYDNPLKKTKFEKQEIIPKVLYNMMGHINRDIVIGISVWRAIYKREIFEKYGIRFCSERQFISEDYIFHLDYIPKCNMISFVEGTYYYYCDNNSASLTRKYNKEKFEKVKILYHEIVRKTKELQIYEETVKGIDYAFIGNVRTCIKQEVCNESKVAKKNIKKICEDELLQEVLHKKYYQTMQQKIFDFLLKKKKSNILYWIISKI